MSASRGRLAVLIGGTSLNSLGWGFVLPYLYSDIATSRGLGASAAAMAYTAFALGSLGAAPLAGRLADRHDPVTVAALARMVFTAAVLALAFAPTVATVWLAAVAVGASSATTQPAVQVLLLRWTPPERQRDVFAWQLIALNLALAVGGLVGGFVVDLSSAAGVLPIFYLAAIGSTASATVVWLVGRSARAAVSVAPTASSVGLAAAPARASAADAISYRTLLRRPPIRWLLAVAVLLQLACYSQFTSGLSAYSLDTLALSPKVIGAAIAANTIAVAALTAPVVRLTRRHSPTTLLTVCVVVWIGCWLVLGLPMLVGGFGAAAVLIGYGSFGIGETVMAPVLSPLAASLAPEGAAGRTLASVTGASTAANAVGPVLSGALLALGLPAGFIVLQLACCALTIAAIRRLRVVSRAGAVSAAGPVGSAGSAGGRGSREPMQPAVAVG